MATVDAETASVRAAEEEPPSSGAALNVLPLFETSESGLLPYPTFSGAESSSISVPPPTFLRRVRTDIRVRQFRRTFYRNVSDKLWNDWHWQISHRIRTLEEIERILVLSSDERAALEQAGAKLPVGITPYYMALISPDNP
ncbi:MAG TPA: lysine 2,3-aminomutase, partial [Thermogutta sp.]|nr:lysine 2,3-aminomutase [Thermogutta sp.]